MNSDDEKISFFGTAFEQLESHEVVSRKPEIDQTVRDERGRRRFHGAFTGGFSAGYWNTVGSAEGFTPQMFKSSRYNKYDGNTGSKPEDFMDEEDFSVYGIAPKKICTTNDFVDNLQFAGMRGNTYEDTVFSVFASTQESIGKCLFRRMKCSSLLEKRIKYGHELLMDDYEKRMEINNIKYQGVDFKCKDNFHGIGYTGAINADKFLFKTSEFSGRETLNNKQNTIQTTIGGGKKLKISGEAFGVGAFDDDDEYDQMSVYFNDDMSQYDFQLGKREEKRQSKKKRKFKDTRNIDPKQIELESFRKSSKSINLFNELCQHYRLPEMPKNWKPKLITKSELNESKRSRWDARTSEPIPVAETLKSDENFNHKSKLVMNANVRSALIGEEVIYKSGIVKKSISSDFVSANTSTHVNRILTGILASKFTSGNTSTNSLSSQAIHTDIQLNAGLSTYAEVTSSNQAFVNKKTDDTYRRDGSEPEPQTRMIFEWHPHRLLCKRFGIHDPFINNSQVGLVVSYENNLKLRDKIKEKSSSFSSITNSDQKGKKSFTNLFQNINEVQDYYSESDTSLGVEFDRFKFTKDKKDKDSNEETTFSVQKASLETLKSVFASDEEDLHSENDENEAVELGKSDVGSKKLTSGLFVGIDFNAVNAQQFNDTNSLIFSSDKKNNNRDDDDDDDEKDYGPALPPSLNDNYQKFTSGDEERSTRKAEKEKKSKKSKKKLKKKDKKKKDKKRCRDKEKKESSSDDNESVEDLDAQIMAFIKNVREKTS